MKAWVTMLALLLPSLLAAEDVRERATVSAVEIALAARDKSGSPIRDLGKNEVRVYEDGKEQKIDLFVPVDLSRRSDAPLPAPAIRRNFILFFDATFNTPGSLLRAKDAASRLVTTMLPEGDQAAVYAFTSSKGVFMVANFTADRRLLLSAIESLGIDQGLAAAADSAGFFSQDMLRAPLDPRLYALALANESERSSRNAALAQWVREMAAIAKINSGDAYKRAVASYLENIRNFARSLELFPGRKDLIFFSTGFDTKVFGARDLREVAEEAELVAKGDFVDMAIQGEARARDLGVELAAMFDQATKYFTSSDCKVFTVDTAGLGNDSNLDFADAPSTDPHAAGRRQASLFSLAKETGGHFYKNINDLDQVLADILKITESFYLLTYAPPQRAPSKSPAFHTIKIDVTRADVELNYRKGYHDMRPFRDLTPDERRLQLAEIIDNNLARDAVSFVAQGLVFPEAGGRCPAAFVVQIPGAQFESQDSELPLEVYAFALGPEGRFESYAHGICRVLAADAAGKLQGNGVRYADVMSLRPGIEYQIRVLVRNNINGDVGTRTISITTRSSGNAFAMATPFFITPKTGWLDVIGYDPKKPPPRAGQTGEEFPVSYRDKPCPVEIFPNLRDGRKRGLLIKLFNFSSDITTKRPDIHISWEVIDDAGKVLAAPRYRLLEPPYRPSDARVEYLFELQTGDLPPGSHWLKVQAGDNQTQQSVTEWVPLQAQ